MRYLAIDPGSKRTGLAVGDDTTGVATPVGVIKAGSDQERLRLIGEAIGSHEPDALVLGLPLNLDGTESPGSREARAMGVALERVYGLAVHLVDERLSSYAADEQMSQSGLTHKGKKRRRDALAAAVILRTFLERG